MPIKITLRLHGTPVRLSWIVKAVTTNARKGMRKGEFSSMVCEITTNPALLEIDTEDSQNIKK